MQTTAPRDSPNKNAIPEVANRILMVKARAMMNDANLPEASVKDRYITYCQKVQGSGLTKKKRKVLQLKKRVTVKIICLVNDREMMTRLMCMNLVAPKTSSLMYWRSGVHIMLPYLKQFAFQYLSIPASSASSEACFLGVIWWFLNFALD